MQVELSLKILNEIEQKLENNARASDRVFSEQICSYRFGIFSLEMYLLFLLESTLFFGIVLSDSKRDVNIVTLVINGMDQLEYIAAIYRVSYMTNKQHHGTSPTRSVTNT